MEMTKSGSTLISHANNLSTFTDMLIILLVFVYSYPREMIKNCQTFLTRDLLQFCRDEKIREIPAPRIDEDEFSDIKMINLIYLM